MKEGIFICLPLLNYDPSVKPHVTELGGEENKGVVCVRASDITAVMTENQIGQCVVHMKSGVTFRLGCTSSAVIHLMREASQLP